MKHNYLKWAQALLFMLFLVGVQAQTTVMLPATKDNSLFSENNNSNGNGDDLFTGRTNQGNLRRTLIQFDLSTIPSGATITDAQLKMQGSRQATNGVAIHRLTADWGEGTSVATGQGGQGASPTNNDATWNFSFFNTTSWIAAGGDFMLTASASTSVNEGATSNWTGANVVTDVQAWIDDSATNFGWILIGDENANSSAVRLLSRESATNAPELEVTYTVADTCAANGGNLTFADGSTELTICAGDGVVDPFMVNITDTVGSNFAWVITDAAGNILGLPSGPTFDLEGAGAGVCLLWGLSFEDGLTGAAVGNNASDLMGCFDLSNPITVNRNGVDGGNLTFADGSTALTICAGDGIDDPFMVNITDTVGMNFAWVITDTTGKILGLPSGPTFNLEGAGDGVCLLWALSFEDGLMGAVVDSNANNLEGCFDLSNPITINRIDGTNTLDGGNLTFADGSTELTICAGDGTADPFMVNLTDTVGTNFAWVITDAAGNILGLPSGPTFDLEGAGEGVCLLWSISFADGLVGAEVGANANDLQGCFDLSNPITVSRTGVDGGNLTFADGSTALTICAGDGIDDPFMVNITDTVGMNFAWVITDTAGKILGLPSGPTFNLEGAGDGVCLLWGLSFEDGLMGAVVDSNANNLEGCFDLSNPITINRIDGTNTLDGGNLTFADGSTELTICAGDGTDDPFMVNLTDTVGTNFAWVITDAAGNILGLPTGPTFDLEGAGDGVCLLWHLSFADGLTGAAVGNNASDLQGCFDLSNPITVNRTGVDGGDLTFADGSTELTICAGDGTPDPFMVNITDTVGTNFAWVITDTAGNILGLPSGPTFDLDPAGPGVCLLWGLSFEDGLTGAAVGNNASDLMGCFDLSNPITVNRNGVDGGILSLEGGGTELTICAGDGTLDPFMVTITDTVGANFGWVITDTAGTILGLPSGPTFDLDGAGPGICLLWGLSFEDGLMGAVVDSNANDLAGCFDLSNPITVTRDTTGSICITSTENIVSAAEIGFEVFPNPAQDRIQFKADFTERPSSLFIEVRSTIGQLMIRKDLDNQQALNETLDINQLTSGIYFITLRTDRSVITQQFLKK